MAGWCPRATAFRRWTSALGSIRNSPLAANQQAFGDGAHERQRFFRWAYAGFRRARGPLKWHITQEMSQTSVLAIPPTCSGVMILVIFYLIRAGAAAIPTISTTTLADLAGLITSGFAPNPPRFTPVRGDSASNGFGSPEVRSRQPVDQYGSEPQVGAV